MTILFFNETFDEVYDLELSIYRKKAFYPVYCLFKDFCLAVTHLSFQMSEPAVIHVYDSMGYGISKFRGT